MKIAGIDVNLFIDDTKKLLEEDPSASPAIKACMSTFLVLFSVLLGRLGLNSKNSSKPPSTDQGPNNNRGKGNNSKPGGQKGRTGKTLTQTSKPDVVEFLEVDRSSLPPGEYTKVGVEKRQVFDLKFEVEITEYQAEVLQDASGKKFVAPFPDEVTQPVQYGAQVKSHAVYLSQYQMLPYERIREYFTDQLSLPISVGTLCNFNAKAYERITELQVLDKIKGKLQNSPVLHVDETGVNINGIRQWLHTASTSQWAYLAHHEKRGSIATDEIAILPNYSGVLVHDHWKPYFKYQCEHALCNAHHLRELEFSWQKEEQKWAREMQDFLLTTHRTVQDSGGKLRYSQLKKHLLLYRGILGRAEQECPEPAPIPGKRGRTKKSKSRNLLERLIKYQKEVLRFMFHPDVPFTNNQAENDIRMSKVQQKISGCFRSSDGAKNFCAIRSYLLSCCKQNISASTALQLLFSGHLPDILVGG